MKTPKPEDFLPLLEREPAKAANLFAHWAYASLTHAPPGVLRSLDDDTRRDIIQEIMFHCIKRNCATLRKYDSRGGKFEAWFHYVVRNKTLSEMDRRGIKLIGDDVDDYTREGASRSVNSSEYNDLLEDVWRCISSLGEKCRRLLKLAAEEYKPGEMTVVLGLMPSDNKQVSEDLRQCRKKLKAALESDGIQYGDIFCDL